MHKAARHLVAWGIAAALAAPMAAQATNGYFLIGYGAKSRAMGGTGVAHGQDGLAAAANPAAMNDVDVSAMRIDVGADFFLPPRSAQHDSTTLPARETSGANVYLIPNMGGIYKFNRNLTIGMAAVGAGLGTRYDADCSKRPAFSSGYFFNFNCNNPDITDPTAGVMLIQMQMLPSVAYKLDRNHSIGASLALAVQMFRAYGISSFGAGGLEYSGNSARLSNNGNDWSYGAGVRVGYLGRFFKKKLSLGANYASRVYMTEFDKYSGLFAEQGDFDIPEHYSLGLAWHPSKAWTLAFDYQRINFSDVKSVGNPGPNPFDQVDFLCATPALPGQCPGVRSGLLGTSNGMGFGWDDMDIYKIGAAWDVNNQWTLRAGFNYAESPVGPEDVLFNLLAPGIMERHATIGASYRPNPAMEFSFELMHAFEETLKGPTAFQPPGADPANPVNNASTSMNQTTIGLSFGYQL